MNIVEHDIHIRKSKGFFGVSNKAHYWQPATWKWVRGRMSSPGVQRIRTRPALDNVWRDELAQVFAGPDAKAAGAYAKALILSGEASTVWIDKEVHLAAGYYGGKFDSGWVVVEAHYIEAAL